MTSEISPELKLPDSAFLRSNAEKHYLHFVSPSVCRVNIFWNLMSPTIHWQQDLNHDYHLWSPDPASPHCKPSVRVATSFTGSLRFTHFAGELVNTNTNTNTNKNTNTNTDTGMLTQCIQNTNEMLTFPMVFGCNWPGPTASPPPISPNALPPFSSTHRCRSFFQRTLQKIMLSVTNQHSITSPSPPFTGRALQQTGIQAGLVTLYLGPGTLALGPCRRISPPRISKAHLNEILHKLFEYS